MLNKAHVGPRGSVAQVGLCLNLHVVLKLVVHTNSHLADQKPKQTKSNYFNVLFKFGVIMQDLLE